MLNDRKEKILKLIVEEQIKTCRPVGSSSLCDKLKVSSATIRNDMSELEEEGYIEKTHISSGRIPSEKGYRYYVDNIMQLKKMNGEDTLKLQTIFSNKSLKLNDTISKSLEIISEITNYTAVVLENSNTTNKLKKVIVEPIDEENVAAIVITDKGHIENLNINVKGCNLNDVKKIVELINKLIVGTPINEISAKLEFEVKPKIAEYINNYEILYKAFYDAFNDFKDNSEVLIKGRNKILDLPEFDDVNKIKKIVSALDEEYIKEKIEEDSEDINIYIGKENNIDDDLTVVKTKVLLNNKESTLAVVGPKRMEYDKVVSLIEFIKENIER